jgi:hypothetical protein
VDEARLDEGKTGVRSPSSLASRSDEEAWPEGSVVSVRSSGAWRRRIPAQNGRERGSPGAPDHGNGEETREGLQLTGFMPKSGDHRGGGGVLRQEISLAWWLLEWGKERGTAEEV